MPSPFPGMDPYLENPALWPNLHILLHAATNAILKPLLQSRGYLVAIGERIKIPRAKARRKPTAVLAIDEPVGVKLFEVEVCEPYLEIIDVQDGRLVTGIEFLSPIDKISGEGRELYKRKQKETRIAGANLVEVDLLRRGRHTITVPERLLGDLPPWDYVVSISRAKKRGEYEVYPVPLTSRLPRIRVPLNAGDEDIALDLQDVMNQAYDASPFEDRVDYSTKPYGRLSAEQAAWCDKVLTDKGLRTRHS